jgi:HK97 gp10 family phage protein
MSVSVTGEAELQRALLSLGKDVDKALRGGVFITAQSVRTDAIKSIQSSSFGSWVRRSSQGGGTYDHVASAPGSAPNTDTGALVSSISVEMDKNKPEAEVGSNLDYASYLEFGTKDMDPRPWLSPAVNRNINNMQANIGKAVSMAIKANAK